MQSGEYLHADFSRLMLWICSNVVLNVLLVKEVLLVNVIYSFGTENSIMTFSFHMYMYFATVCYDSPFQ